MQFTVADYSVQTHASFKHLQVPSCKLSIQSAVADCFVQTVRSNLQLQIAPYKLSEAICKRKLLQKVFLRKSEKNGGTVPIGEWICARSNGEIEKESDYPVIKLLSQTL